MSLPQFEVKTRSEAGKGVARKLRAEGLIPGVYYGPGVEPQSLSLDPTVLQKIMKASPSRTFLLELVVDGESKKAMLKQVQVHPVSRQVLHADFYSVSADRPVTLEILVRYAGTPVGEFEDGVTEYQHHFVALTGLPDALPTEIQADISGLAVGDALRIGDLKLSEGVTAEGDSETVLCSVAIPARVVLDEEGEEGEGEEGEEASAAEESSEE